MNVSSGAQRVRVRWSAVVVSLLMVGTVDVIAAEAQPDWSSLTVSKQEKMTPEEAIELAFERSPFLGKAVALVKKGEAQIDEARSAYYPQISMSSGYGKNQVTSTPEGENDQFSIGPKLNQRVYDFGKTSGAVGNQQGLTNSYRQDLMSTMTGVAGDTLLAYSTVKRYQKSIEVAQLTVESLQKVETMAKARVVAGLSSASDQLQAETRIASLKTIIEQLQAELNAAKANLAVLTGKNVETLTDMPPALQKITVKPDAIDYKNISAMRSALEQQQAAEALLTATKAQHLPDISVGASRVRQRAQGLPDWETQLGLSVDVSIYQGGAVSARVQQAYEALNEARSTVNQAKLTVDQKASTAWANWVGADARVQLGESQVSIASRTRDIYRQEYQLDERSLSDLLSVEQDVYQAMSSHVAAQFDRWDAAVNYAVALDNLLPLLGIDRPVQKELPDF